MNDTKKTETVVEIHDLTVSYNRKPVLWDIDLTIPAGKVVGILGPNGAGKSTLLKTIMGLLIPDCGYVKIFDHPFESVRDKVSYVPQRESVDWDFPASALDVVLMGRYAKIGLFKRPKSSDIELARTCLEKVGMLQFADRQISQLSGGQQQRVFIARALAQEAQLYFMDEPFAGVDANTENLIMNILKDIANNGGTVVVVHHDLQTIEKYFDWLIMVNMRLIASGPTKETMTDKILEETYGGKLRILSKIGRELEEKNLAPREPLTNF